LHLNPSLPKQWQGYSFRITFRGALLKVTIASNSVMIENESDTGLTLRLAGVEKQVAARQVLTVAR
jgi:maltose phosphorylase